MMNAAATVRETLTRSITVRGIRNTAIQKPCTIKQRYCIYRELSELQFYVQPLFFLLICLWLVKTSLFSISTFGCYLHFQKVGRSQFLLNQILNLPWFYFLTYYYYSIVIVKKSKQRCLWKYLGFGFSELINVILPNICL